MARYETPKVYYQSSIDANTAVEVTHFKSLSWANRTNNNGSFELIIRVDSVTFVPADDGYVRLDPGDTIMNIEKIVKECDAKGICWYKISGRPTQQEDDIVREAKNDEYYFRYVYDGSNSERYNEHFIGTPVTQIESVDIVESSTYKDSLGGYYEEVLVTPGKPAVPGYSWGTEIVGQPRVTVNHVQRQVMGSVTIPPDALTLVGAWKSVLPLSGGMTIEFWHYPNHPDRGKTITEACNYTEDEIVIHEAPTISVGTASGPDGGMNNIVYQGSWIIRESQTIQRAYGTTWYEYVIRTWPNAAYNGHIVGEEIDYQYKTRAWADVLVKTVTVKTEQQYLAEMRAALNSNPNSSGHVATIPEILPTYKTIYVKGGHDGYSCKIKSKGEMQKRYKVDFNLGDTIAVNDTRLDVVYTGVVSGAVETIDKNGYNVDIEIGTLGATLEQRVRKVI